MSAMTRSVEIAGRTVLVRELTVGAVRAWLAALAAPDAAAAGVDLVGELLLPGVSLDDLRRMTDADAALFDAATPSELGRLAAACREVNQDFFSLRAKLVAAALSPDAATSPPPSTASRTP